MADQQIVREWDPAVGNWKTHVQPEAAGGGGGSLPDPLTTPINMETDAAPDDYTVLFSAKNAAEDNLFSFDSSGSVTFSLRDQYAAFAVEQSSGHTGADLIFRAGSALKLTNDRVGFFPGTTPVAQPAAPTTLQELADAIGDLGLTAAPAEGISSGAPVAANVPEIADPATATAEDCANSINAVIFSLVTAGLMAE